MTPEAQLVQLNNAIAKAEVKQRYKIGDRELQAGDLRWMYPERARLAKHCGPAPPRWHPLPPDCAPMSITVTPAGGK
jgi:hypothetical protein